MPEHLPYEELKISFDDLENLSDEDLSLLHRETTKTLIWYKQIDEHIKTSGHKRWAEVTDEDRKRYARLKVRLAQMKQMLLDIQGEKAHRSNIKKRENIYKHNESALSDDRAFIEAAKLFLTKEQYLQVWQKAREMLGYGAIKFTPQR